MEREQIEGRLCGIAQNVSCEARCYECPSPGVVEILAEFDRLKLKVAALAADLWDSQAALDEAGNWLGTISEPITRDGDIEYIRRTVVPLLYEQCKDISAKTLECVLDYLDSQKPSEADCHVPIKQEPNKWQFTHAGGLDGRSICNPPSVKYEGKSLRRCSYHGNYWSILAGDCPMCKKPSVKPNHVHSDDSSVFWEGKEEDCPICNPKHLCNDGIWEYIPKSECQRCNPPKCEHKPLTRCPECIWGQKRREFTAVEGAYCKYVVYERCPRCRGGGRISC